MVRQLPTEEQKKAARIRQDALVGIHLHNTRISRLSARTRFTDWLALAVPILYVPVRFLAKGTSVFQTVEAVWEVLAATLLVTAASRIVLQWDRQLEEHYKYRDDDLRLADQAAGILDGVTQEGITRLNALDQISRRQDFDSIHSTVAERQKAYRMALMEFYTSGEVAECPHCHSRPDEFMPGDCPACGNTRRTQRDTEGKN